VNAIPNPASSNTDKNFLVALLRESRENFWAALPVSLRNRAASTSRKLLVCARYGGASNLRRRHHARLITDATQAAISGCAKPWNRYFCTWWPTAAAKMQSPEGGRPCGRFASLAEAAAQFKASRDKPSALSSRTQKTCAPLKSRIRIRRGKRQHL